MRVEVDVVVVGVGGFGSAALLHLASRGLSVVGVERFAVPHDRGSSTGETRVIRKAYFEDPRYVPLLHRAYALWADLERDVGESLIERVGCLTFGPPDHQALIGVQQSVTEHQLPHELLDDTAITKRFPSLVPARGDVGVFEVDAGFLHVERCTTAHARLAQQRGARLITGARVVGLDASHGEFVDVDLDADFGGDGAGGKELRARHVVIAGGAWLAADPVLRAFAGPLALTVERQVQLWFARPSSSPPPCFIHFGDRGAFYGIPGEHEQKACRHHGGRATDPDLVDRVVSDADVDDVRGFLRSHLPSADGALLRSKVCLYTNTDDENFVIGRSPWSSRVVVVGGCSGHGYKMASVIGEIAADLVDVDRTGGQSRFDLAVFSPTRLAVSAAKTESRH